MTDVSASSVEAQNTHIEVNTASPIAAFIAPISLSYSGRRLDFAGGSDLPNKSKDESLMVGEGNRLVRSISSGCQSITWQYFQTC